MELSCKINLHASGKDTKPLLPMPRPEVGESKPLLASFINLNEKHKSNFVNYLT